MVGSRLCLQGCELLNCGGGAINGASPFCVIFINVFFYLILGEILDHESCQGVGFFIIPVVAAAHPGGGLIAMDANTVIFGDSMYNSVWRLEKGKKPRALIDKFHAHWTTRGLDGHIYSEEPTRAGHSRYCKGGVAWSGRSLMYEFNYRTANVADAEALVPLINRAFEIELQFFTTGRIDLAETLEYLKKGTFLLAEYDGELAGCNYVEMRGEVGYFGLLSVDPAHQGRGLGRKLIEQAEDFCCEAGCSLMQIRVLNHRTELPPFYEKLGYNTARIEEVEQVPSARMPYHFIVMEKILV